MEKPLPPFELEPLHHPRESTASIGENDFVFGQNRRKLLDQPVGVDFGLLRVLRTTCRILLFPIANALDPGRKIRKLISAGAVNQGAQKTCGIDTDSEVNFEPEPLEF